MTPATRMVAITHASNVIGTILPVREIAEVAHRAGALLLLDAAQTAGVLPIDVTAMGVDLLAFTGHKGLQGPPGTGGLVIGERVQTGLMEPLVRGGTGSRSEHEFQPEEYPDKFESGTANGSRHCRARSRRALGVEAGSVCNPCSRDRAGGDINGRPWVYSRELRYTVSIIRQTARPSCRSRCSGKRVSEIGLRLDEEYGIMSRVGLHCAPAAHRTIGTFPEGTVRFAAGVSTTAGEIRAAIDAVARIASRQYFPIRCRRGARACPLVIVLFHTSSAAIRSEKILLKSGLTVKLVPTPRQFSSDCGIALRFEWNQEAHVRQLLESAGVNTAAIRSFQ